jgi:excisionase family DNA binding protein
VSSSTSIGYLTVKEAAAHVRLTPSPVYRALEEGRLTGYKVCNRWRIKVSDLQDWVESGRNGPRPTDTHDPMPRARGPSKRFSNKLSLFIEGVRV